MNRRLLGLGHVARQQPYEGAMAFALGLAAAWSLWGPPQGAGVLGRVLVRWQVQAADCMVITGAVLTLGGLVAVGVVRDAVHRVVARRVEQSGQVLLGGVWVAFCVAAFSLGAVGVVGGLVYGALGWAAVLRGVQAGRLAHGSGVERTEVAG